MSGWGGRIRTSVWRNQNPLPYHLATPQASPGRPGSRDTHKAARAAPQYACGVIPRRRQTPLTFRFNFVCHTTPPARGIRRRAGRCGRGAGESLLSSHTDRRGVALGVDFARDRAFRRRVRGAAGGPFRPPRGASRRDRLGVLLADGRDHADAADLVLRPGPVAQKHRARGDHGRDARPQPWWYGWGIHLTPRGWLYNVGGLDAVELALNNGRTLRIGSDEAAALARALM